MNTEHWFDEINRKIIKIKLDFSETMSNEELIHVVLNNLPNEYDDLNLKLIIQRNISLDPLTLQSMVDQLKDYYKYSNNKRHIFHFKNKYTMWKLWSIVISYNNMHK